MEKRVPLPSGNWADLREVREISERNRRPMAKLMASLSPEVTDKLFEVKKKMTDEDVTDLSSVQMAQVLASVRFTPEDIEIFSEMNDHCVVALVKQWSFPEPITLENVQDLTTPDYDTLRQVSVVAIETLFTDFNINPHPASPTPASNGSVTPLEAEASGTVFQPTSGGPIGS